MLELVCTNVDCPAQNISSLCHYLATFGVLGLGESRVTQLVEGNLISVPADFYRLDVESAHGVRFDRTSVTACRRSDPDDFRSRQNGQRVASASDR